MRLVRDSLPTTPLASKDNTQANLNTLVFTNSGEGSCKQMPIRLENGSDRSGAAWPGRVDKNQGLEAWRGRISP